MFSEIVEPQRVLGYDKESDLGSYASEAAAILLVLIAVPFAISEDPFHGLTAKTLAAFTRVAFHLRPLCVEQFLTFQTAHRATTTPRFQAMRCERTATTDIR